MPFIYFQSINLWKFIRTAIITAMMSINNFNSRLCHKMMHTYLLLADYPSKSHKSVFRPLFIYYHIAWLHSHSSIFKSYANKKKCNWCWWWWWERSSKKNFFDFLLTQQKKLFLQTAAECSSSGGKININQWQFAIWFMAW